MSRKGENIFKRRDGRWEARYVKERDASGRIRYGFCYGRTYREAKEKVTKIRGAMLSGAPAPVPAGRRRFGDYCREWLGLTRQRVRESTYIKYDTAMRLHILPALGALPPAELTTLRVEQLRRELTDSGLSAATVRDCLVVLKSALRYMSSQLPGVLPAVEIAYPKSEKREARVLTPEEQRRLVDVLRTDTDACKFGVLLSLLTGLRVGEICALRWERLDTREGTIRVAATMQRLRDPDLGGTRVVVGKPKSGSSDRLIPMSDTVRALCRRFDPGDTEAYVLTGTREFMEPRKLQRRFDSYTRACGLEGVHFHTLRHTFATRCMEVGFEIKSLSEILGHSSTSITLDRYVHASMEVKRVNMNLLSTAGL